jgi:hypothetical protein
LLKLSRRLRWNDGGPDRRAPERKAPTGGESESVPVDGLRKRKGPVSPPGLSRQIAEAIRT